MNSPSRRRAGRAEVASQHAPAPEDLDRIAAAWTRVGVLFGVPVLSAPIDLEVLIRDTAQVAPWDERLFVCAASWLASYHGFINGRRLSALCGGLTRPASATLGVLLSLASEASSNAPELGAALARCRPLAPPRPLFTVMNTMQVLRDRVKRRALPIFSAWGLWHDDATLKPTAIRPMRWILEQVPELRARALLGPSVEADVMAHALASDVTAQDVARDTHVSYAATHDAVSRLVSRGLLVRERMAQRQLLRPTAMARATLRA